MVQIMRVLCANSQQSDSRRTKEPHILRERIETNRFRRDGETVTHSRLDRLRICIGAVLNSRPASAPYRWMDVIHTRLPLPGCIMQEWRN